MEERTNSGSLQLYIDPATERQLEVSGSETSVTTMSSIKSGQVRSQFSGPLAQSLPVLNAPANTLKRPNPPERGISSLSSSSIRSNGNAGMHATFVTSPGLSESSAVNGGSGSTKTADNDRDRPGTWKRLIRMASNSALTRPGITRSRESSNGPISPVTFTNPTSPNYMRKSPSAPIELSLGNVSSDTTVWVASPGENATSSEENGTGGYFTFKRTSGSATASDSIPALSVSSSTSFNVSPISPQDVGSSRSSSKTGKTDRYRGLGISPAASSASNSRTASQPNPVLSPRSLFGNKRKDSSNSQKSSSVSSNNVAPISSRIPSYANTTSSHPTSFASRLLRRVSSMPNTKEYAKHQWFADANNQNMPPPNSVAAVQAAANKQGAHIITVTQAKQNVDGPTDTAYLSPNGHSVSTSIRDIAGTPTSHPLGMGDSVSRSAAGFSTSSSGSTSGLADSTSSLRAPGSPLFLKARNGSYNRPDSNLYRPGGGLNLPSSSSLSSTSTSNGTMTQFSNSSPSSPSGLTVPNSPSSPRQPFRRTYSSNSIKIRNVEVGPSSFQKIKLLGKGDVGKVYLVREKKTERLFAMKVLSKREMIRRKKIKRALAEQVNLNSELKSRETV